MREGTRRDALYGRLDPLLARLSSWADEDPGAMRRLLTDPELRAQLLGALDDLDGAEELGPAAGAVTG